MNEDTNLDIADNGDGWINLGELLNGQDGRHERCLGTVVLCIGLNAHQLLEIENPKSREPDECLFQYGVGRGKSGVAKIE